MDPEVRWWIRLAGYLALAMAGGALGYIMRALDKGERPSLSRVSVEALAAGFAGLLIIFLCQVSNIGEEMTGFIVGIGGWLGASATIRRLEPFAFRNQEKP